MNKTKSKKNKTQNKTEQIGPDHFTVFKLKTDEKEMADVWLHDTIKMFKELICDIYLSITLDSKN